MGVKINKSDLSRIRRKLVAVVKGLGEDAMFAAEAGADAIVQTTLAGIGADDSSFAPYSAKYADRKGSTLVDLRGAFYRDGRRRSPLGLVDPDSEMSRDLLRIEEVGGKVRISYSPRRRPYMLYHNDGTGTAPRRNWFTARKTAVQGSMNAAMRIALKARAAWFNNSR